MQRHAGVGGVAGGQVAGAAQQPAAPPAAQSAAEQEAASQLLGLIPRGWAEKDREGTGERGGVG